jgi:hypothetical protein
VETDLDVPNMGHGEAVCLVECLFVREGPGLQYKVIGSLTTGDVVTVWMTQAEWWRIQTVERFDVDGPKGSAPKGSAPKGSALTGWSHSGYLQPVRELVRGA